MTTGRPGTPQQQLLTPQAALPATAVAPSPTPSAAQQTSHLQKSTRGKHLEGSGQILPGEIPIRLPEGLKQCLVQDFHNNNEELSQVWSLQLFLFAFQLVNDVPGFSEVTNNRFLTVKA